MASFHDEQLTNLEKNIKGKEEKIKEYEIKLKSLNSEFETANIYIMGHDTKPQHGRICPISGCDGKGNSRTQGSSHYT